MNIPPETPKVIPGRPIPRRALGRLAEIAAETARSVASVGLAMSRVAGIPNWRNIDDGRFFVRLSGASNPYSATQVQPKPGGSWETFSGGVSLASNVYADNGETGLNGKVVELFRTPGDWWRFPYPRKGQTNPPPPSCTASRSCAFVVDQVTGLGVPGIAIAITFSKPGASPAFATTTGTTDSDGKFCADPPTGPTGTVGNPQYIVATTALGATLSIQPTYDTATGTCDAHFKYCKRIVIAYAYDGDGGDPGPGGGMAATLGSPPGYAIGQQIADGSVVPAAGVGIVNDGTSVTYTSELLTSPGSSLIGRAGVVPEYVAAYASGYYGYVGLCVDASCGFNFFEGGCVSCGGTGYLPIPLFSQSKYAWNPACDPGGYSTNTSCHAYNFDPRTLVIPKTLFATFTGPEPIFGGDSGNSVTIHWDANSWDGRSDHRKALAPYLSLPHGDTTSAWKSDCGSSGSYGGCYVIGDITCLNDDGAGPPIRDTVLDHVVPYGSRQVILTYNYQTGSSLNYNNYWNATCNPLDTAPICFGSVATNNAVRATPFRYCPWTTENHLGKNCPVYSTHPAPTFGQGTYGKSYGVQGVIGCQDSVFALSTTTVAGPLPVCSYSVTIGLSE